MKFNQIYTKLTSNNRTIVGSMESDDYIKGTAINQAESDFVPVEDENLSDAQEFIRNEVRDEYAKSITGKEDLTEPLTEEQEKRVDEHVASMESAIRAAAFVLPAIASPGSSRKHYDEGIKRTHEGENIDVIGLSQGMESFQLQNVTDFKEESVAFHLTAARQTPFNALFHPMLVGTSEQSDWLVGIDRVMYGNFAQHEAGKAINDTIGWKPLQNAYSDTDAIKNNAIDLVPYFNESTKKDFVDPTHYSVRKTTLDNHEFDTLDLKAGHVVKSLIGLSQHPGRTEAYTQNAAVHKNVQLTNLALKVTDRSDPANPVVECFRLATNYMPNRYFNRVASQVEGELTLTFRNNQFIFDAAATAKGEASTIFKDLKDVESKLRISIETNGRINLNTSEMKVNGTVELEEQFNKDGDTVELDPKWTALEYAIDGYTVQAKATNSDLAHISLLADTIRQEQYVKIGIHAPIIAHNPLVKDVNAMSGEKKLAIIADLAKAYMNASGVNSFIDYNETIKEEAKIARREGVVKNDYGSLWEHDKIAGIARKVMNVAHLERNVPLPEVTNSLESKDKMTNARKYLSGLMSNLFSQLVQESRILTALPIYSPESKVIAKIVTSPRIYDMLMIEGDSRTMGNSQFSIVADPALKFVDKIYMQLSVDNASANRFHFLNSGYLLYIPEMIGRWDTIRGNSRINEMAIQPQFEYIHNVPAMAEITIEGLTQFIEDKTTVAVDVKSTTTP